MNKKEPFHSDLKSKIKSANQYVYVFMKKNIEFLGLSDDTFYTNDSMLQLRLWKDKLLIANNFNLLSPKTKKDYITAYNRYLEFVPRYKQRQAA